MDQSQRIKERAALASIAASALLTLAKFTAALFSGSLALLSEAGNNLVDTGMSFIAFQAVRVAGKPADAEHNYGHGKVEALAALIETAFLFALAAFVVVEAALRLTHRSVKIDANALAFGVLIVSLVVDTARVYLLSRIARETKSEALAAEVVNFVSDIVGSSIALLGLVAARFGFMQGDAIAAIAVAIYIAIAGYRLARRTIDTLMDAAPQGAAARVRTAALGVPGVIAVENLRLRPVGAQVLGDIAISVPRTLSQDEVTAIKGNVGAAIATAQPETELTVETIPVALNDETVIERLLLIAARRHIAIHHVIVQQVCGKIALSCDIEVDGAMPLGQAHSIASGLEAEARKEFGPETEIDTHIEPLEPRELAGQDAPEDVRAAIANALSGAATDGIRDVHDVRVRETAAGLVVNYHCRANPRTSVAEVHRAVDKMEHEVRQQFSAISRLVGHAEPLRLSEDIAGV
ncbi:cation transporter [Methylovirgula ligni]|uniref:Cation diffusion facilitator family transporter n=1 Tax=Methylovirgula ligni TaxID=569860 RepID=A0A3D9Z0G3_9HYPH|nr:cation diffusion facilitator family transporter [Methylovirgula ligni]QAY96837.1 cation transporter [Methylovirgula ligni]REF88125.1 cation diffusion facilitator family transporter [Methylovirgula ligni]